MDLDINHTYPAKSTLFAHCFECDALGTLNIHPSLLPRWRGASPVQRTLEAGDKKSGVSVLWTVSKMDAGPIAAQYECDLVGDEKAPEFLNESISSLFSSTDDGVVKRTRKEGNAALVSDDRQTPSGTAPARPQKSRVGLSARGGLSNRHPE